MIMVIPSVPAESETIYYNNYNNYCYYYYYYYYVTTPLQWGVLVSTGVHPCPVGPTGISVGVSATMIVPLVSA